MLKINSSNYCILQTLPIKCSAFNQQKHEMDESIQQFHLWLCNYFFIKDYNCINHSGFKSYGSEDYERVETLKNWGLWKSRDLGRVEILKK